MIELDVIFREYLACFAERRLDDLGDYVHDRLTVNGQSITLADYIANIAGILSVVPDLEWTLEDVVTDGTMLAARLTDTGTPRAEWFGVPATGRRVSTTEFAMYRFRDGKIEAGWFQVDVQAIQSGSTASPSE